MRPPPGLVPPKTDQGDSQKEGGKATTTDSHQPKQPWGTQSSKDNKPNASPPPGLGPPATKDNNSKPRPSPPPPGLSPPGLSSYPNTAESKSKGPSPSPPPQAPTVDKIPSPSNTVESKSKGPNPSPPPQAPIVGKTPPSPNTAESRSKGPTPSPPPPKAPLVDQTPPPPVLSRPPPDSSEDSIKQNPSSSQPPPRISPAGNYGSSKAKNNRGPGPHSLETQQFGPSSSPSSSSSPTLANIQTQGNNRPWPRGSNGYTQVQQASSAKPVSSGDFRRGQGQQQQGGRGPGKGQKYMPKAEEAPPLTRRQIEEDQRRALEKSKQATAQLLANRSEEKRRVAEPLEKRTSLVMSARTGAPESIQDLNEYWVKTHALDMLPFIPDGEVLPDNLVFDEVVAMICDDVTKLLHMVYHVFWSHVVYNKSLRKLIDTFLRYFPRSYDTLIKAPSYLSLNRLYTLMIKLFLRMSTAKESEGDFMTPDYFASLIYDNWVWDIPKLMDVAALYPGSANMQLGRQVVQSVFEVVPGYWDDLKGSIETSARVVGEVAALIRSSPTEKDDAVTYLGDIISTLHFFLLALPGAAHLFLEHEFHQKVVANYKLLKGGKRHATGLVYEVLRHCFIDPLSGVKDTCHLCHLMELPHLDESFHNAMETVLSSIGHDDNDFLRDIVIRNRLDTAVKQISTGLDKERLDYLVMVLASVAPQLPTEVVRPAASPPAPQQKLDRKGKGKMVATTEVSPVPESVDAKAVESVRDLFPTLSEATIAQVLSGFEMDVERTIHYFLENPSDNIQQEAANAEKRAAAGTSAATSSSSSSNAIRERESGVVPLTKKPPLVSQRANIFEGDEFDITSRNKVDVSRVHKGKWGMDNAEEKLSTDDSWRARVLYEDEYDDSYDEFMPISVADADNDEQQGILDAKRPLPAGIHSLNQKPKERQLAGWERDDEEENDEDEEEDGGPATPQGALTGRMPGPPTAKGPGQSQQGQTKQQPKAEPSLKQRAWKEKNKSKMANHNRKDRATRKMMRPLGLG